MSELYCLWVNNDGLWWFVDWARDLDAAGAKFKSMKFRGMTVRITDGFDGKVLDTTQ